MRYTKIEIEGQAGNFATIARKRGAEFIEVEVITPGGARRHSVQADDRGDRWSMAEVLQHDLDGFRGAGGDVREYFDAVERFAD